jgi:NADH-quinone oxidoreductase subunit M
LLPVLTALLIAALPDRHPAGKNTAHFLTGLATVTGFAWTLHYLQTFLIQPAFKITQTIPWIILENRSFDLIWRLDGLSLFFVISTGLVFTVLYFLQFPKVQNQKVFNMAFLFLQAAIYGVFLSFNLLQFYFFWELLLIPVFILMGVFGTPHARGAALKFVLFTFVFSLFMFIGILYIGAFAGFDLAILSKTIFDSSIAEWLCLVFVLAFLVKLPLMPLHFWLKPAVAESPALMGTIFVALLFQLGVYALVRIPFTLFPQALAHWSLFIYVLSALTIWIGALIAVTQKELRALLAFSSLSHMGMMLAGITTLKTGAVIGALFLSLTHGLTALVLFLLVGHLEKQRGTTEIAEFGGLAAKTPRLAVFFVIAVFAYIALPGLANFIGEFLVFVGLFQTLKFNGLFFTPGVILGAAYMLWVVERVFFGNFHHQNKNISNLKLKEKAVIVPLLILILVLGFYPRLITQSIETAVAPSATAAIDKGIQK